MRRRAGVRGAVGWLALAAALVTPWSFVPSSGADDEPSPGTDLYLVTLRSPGTSGYDGSLPLPEYRSAMLTQQDRLLDQVGDDDPVYRWTTALNGFAVHLTTLEAGRLAAQPQVRLVERDTVRPVTGAAAPATAPVSVDRLPAAGEGGRGHRDRLRRHRRAPAEPGLRLPLRPGAAPAQLPRVVRAGRQLGPLGLQRQDHRRPLLRRRVRGRRTCAPAPTPRRTTTAATAPSSRRWRPATPASTPSTATRTTAPSRVPRPRPGSRSTRPAGPRPTPTTTAARVPTWSRPWTRRWPTGSTYSMSPSAAPPTLDTVDLALLGAAEQDVFVSAAAGNDGGQGRARAALGHHRRRHHRTPAHRHPDPPGRHRAERRDDRDPRRRAGPDRAGPRHPGTRAGPAREATYCVPGALDAGRAAGRLVVCERGLVAPGRQVRGRAAGRRRRDGPGEPPRQRPRRRLPRAAQPPPRRRATAASCALPCARPGALTGRLAREAAPDVKPRLLPTSGSGSGAGQSVEPDLVAPGAELLAATSPSGSNARWELTTGTSAATAFVSGWAARVRAAHPDWSAARIRSALMTSGTSVGGEPGSLRQGAGLPRPDLALRPGLVYDVPRSAWRRALNRQDAERLNLPSVLLSNGRGDRHRHPPGDQRGQPVDVLLRAGLGLHQPPGPGHPRGAPDRPRRDPHRCGSAWPRAPAYDLGRTAAGSPGAAPTAPGPASPSSSPTDPTPPNRAFVADASTTRALLRQQRTVRGSQQRTVRRGGQASRFSKRA